ncbi:nucleotide exchange factor GrpE [Marinimicrobium agarilyticum]|uniref:nucleotide exchange factor GrpE n=1 Tax=Marinimicrobium agarilyticum TaxID=306546 RepID=UPI0003FF0221|nr:nucleotide exchange factor GrpE [Marinimicrobium agarilyticum]
MANEDKREAQEPVGDAAEAQAADTEVPEGQEQAGGEETVESLKATIESLNAAMDAAKEQVLRSQAEAQNARIRAEKDVEKAHKFGQEKLLQDLLPVVDNLERALASMDRDNADFKSVIEGIELTHKSFVDALAKYNVESVDPAGEPFDPELHQAMTMVPNPDVEPNTVIEVFQKGYTLNGRLVRPAMVVVSKGAE